MVETETTLPTSQTSKGIEDEEAENVTADDGTRVKLTTRCQQGEKLKSE